MSRNISQEEHLEELLMPLKFMDIATIGFIGGFIIMMSLDVVLG